MGEGFFSDVKEKLGLRLRPSGRVTRTDQETGDQLELRSQSFKQKAKAFAKGGSMLSIAFREGVQQRAREVQRGAREAQRENPARQSLFHGKRVVVGKTKKGKLKYGRTQAFLKPQGSQGFVSEERRQLATVDLGYLGMPEGSRSMDMLDTTQNNMSADDSILNPRRRR